MNAPRTRLEREGSPTQQTDIDWEALLIAGFGAACALLAWLVIGSLTGLGKFTSLLFPSAIVVALIGAIIGLTRAAIVLWIASAMAILAFCVIAMTPFVTSLLPTRSMVRDDALPKTPLDAVIVLSAGITPDSLLSGEAADRLLAGLALMRDSVAPVLVVTEPRRSSNGATAAPDQRRLRSLVARPFSMLTVGPVHTTRDEAVAAMSLLRQRGATHVAVVTSPLHTRRACATFEHIGFDVTCVSAVSRAYSVDAADTGADRLALFREWIYERSAWLEYRLRGWVN